MNFFVIKGLAITCECDFECPQFLKLQTQVADSVCDVTLKLHPSEDVKKEGLCYGYLYRKKNTIPFNQGEAFFKSLERELITFGFRNVTLSSFSIEVDFVLDNVFILLSQLFQLGNKMKNVFPNFNSCFIPFENTTRINNLLSIIKKENGFIGFSIPFSNEDGNLFEIIFGNTKWESLCNTKEEFEKEKIVVSFIIKMKRRFIPHFLTGSNTDAFVFNSIQRKKVFVFLKNFQKILLETYRGKKTNDLTKKPKIRYCKLLSLFSKALTEALKQEKEW